MRDKSGNGEGKLNEVKLSKTKVEKRRMDRVEAEGNE